MMLWCNWSIRDLSGRYEFGGDDDEPTDWFDIWFHATGGVGITVFLVGVYWPNITVLLVGLAIVYVFWQTRHDDCN